MTSCAPWAPDTPALLPFTLGQHVEVVATHPDVEDLALELEAGTLSFDERRAPRAQLTMTARVPQDQAALAALDPRRGVRLAVRAGYRRPGSLALDVHPVGDLLLQRREVARPGDVVTLTAGGDELIALGNVPDTASTLPSSDLGTAVLALLTSALQYAPAVVENTMHAQSVQPDDVVPTQDYWTQIEDRLDRAEGDLFDDGLRGWHLIDRPVLAEPAHQLLVGAGGTLTGAGSTLDRLDWHNAAQVTYRWQTTTTVLVQHELDGGLALRAAKAQQDRDALAARIAVVQAALAANPGVVEGQRLRTELADLFHDQPALVAAAEEATGKWQASGTTEEQVTTEHVVIGTAAVTAGPFTPALAGGRRVYREERDVATTQAAADGAAATLLGRRVASGRTLDLEAIAAWWLRPGHTVRVRLPAGDLEDHLVVAVDFDLTSGRMRVATRLPDATTVITPGA